MKGICAPAAVVIAVSLLGGCATPQLERTAAFSSASDTSLVVFGVDIQSGFKDPALVFRKYDPATGTVDQSGVVHATRRRDKLSAGQKVGAYLTGQQSLPNEHGYFVLQMPPGDWFLWAISGFYSDGVSAAYSATTFLSEGTVAFNAKAGTAVYVGEYIVAGQLGDNLALRVLDSNLNAAQTELDTFTGVQTKLELLEPTKTRFTCESKRMLIGKSECDASSTVVGKGVVAPVTTQ